MNCDKKHRFTPLESPVPLEKSFLTGFTSIIQSSLKEDIGKKDITTEFFIPKDKIARAVLRVKEDCIVCGLNIAKLVFKTMDKGIKFKSRVLDGQYIKSEKIIAKLEGKAQSILTAERVALNFLSLLSGIATKTRRFVDAVKPYRVKIMDTRKTIPGLRRLQKYAVKIGGGHNHRMGLDEMVLIKDNHIKIQNSKFKIQNLIKNREKIPPGMKIEIEVKNLRELREALKLKPDTIMLDNMSIKDMRKAAKMRNNLSPDTKNSIPKLEASGRISLENVRKVAATGVDMISVGDLTHSVKSVDVSLEIL